MQLRSVSVAYSTRGIIFFFVCLSKVLYSSKKKGAKRQRREESERKEERRGRRGRRTESREEDQRKSDRTLLPNRASNFKKRNLFLGAAVRCALQRMRGWIFRVFNLQKSRLAQPAVPPSSRFVDISGDVEVFFLIQTKEQTKRETKKKGCITNNYKKEGYREKEEAVCVWKEVYRNVMK